MKPSRGHEMHSVCTWQVWRYASAAVALTCLSEAFGAEITGVPGDLRTSSAGTAILTVAVQHSSGPEAIKTVAAAVTGSERGATFPRLYDDGTHGDSAANDGLYSLEVDLGSKHGEYSVTYYVVDHKGAEITTEPMTFTLE
jgi:hypothetical protein